MKKSKLYQDTEDLVKLMTKYDTTDRATLQGKIHLQHDEQDKDTLKTLIRSTNWPKVYKTATEERAFKMVTDNMKTYYDIFMSLKTDQPTLQNQDQK